MSVQEVSRRSGPFEGDGSTKEFSFHFKVFNADNVAVYVSDEDDGDVQLTQGYTVELNDDQDALPGGTVILTDPLPDGLRLSILSCVPYDQPMVLTNQGGFYPRTINDSADRLAIQVQQLLEEMKRTLKVPATSSMTPWGLLLQIFQAAKSAASSAEEAEKYAQICEEIKEYVEVYSWDIPHLVDSIRDVEDYPYDGFFVVGGYGNAGGNGQNISNRYVKAEGSTELRTLGERFADVVNVRDFGAKGDGVTDDTTAIQAALDAAKGKIAFFPPGVYAVSDTLIARTGTKVQGSGNVDIWEQNYSIGTVIKTIGAGTAQRWTDISDDDASIETPLLVAGGNGVFFEDITLLTQGESLWSIGLFFPCVKQCGYSHVNVIGFTNAPIYLDATWSDRNTVLKTLHPEIETSTGMNEFYGENFYAQGVSVGVKVQGTKRDPDNYESDSEWQWGWGGASDIVFMKGRCSGIWVDGAIYNGAQAIQGIRFIYVDTRIGSRDISIYLDRANRVDFIGGYGEATGGQTPQIHFTSRTGYVNFLYCAYSGHVYFDGSDTGYGLVNGPVIGSKVSIITSTGRLYTPGYILNETGFRAVADGAFGLGTNTYNFLRLNAQSIRSNSSSLPLQVGSDTILELSIGAALFETENVRPRDSEASSLGSSTYRWNLIHAKQVGTTSKKVDEGHFDNLYTTSGGISTSDEREKLGVASVSDELLDAWGSVGFKLFQFKEAVSEKGGDSARFHVGVIAQDVQRALLSEGLDATRYGLFCHDEWQDAYEDIEVIDREAVEDEEGRIISPRESHIEHRKVQSSGDRYGIRYEEALCLEAAYQRRRADRLEERLAALEKRMTIVEAQ